MFTVRGRGKRPTSMESIMFCFVCFCTIEQKHGRRCRAELLAVLSPGRGSS